MTELMAKTCPFCGMQPTPEPARIKAKGYWTICCQSKEHLVIFTRFGKNRVIAAWNSRSGTGTTIEQNAAPIPQFTPEFKK